MTAAATRHLRVPTIEAIPPAAELELLFPIAGLPSCFATDGQRDRARARLAGLRAARAASGIARWLGDVEREAYRLWCTSVDAGPRSATQRNEAMEALAEANDELEAWLELRTPYTGTGGGRIESYRCRRN